MTNLFLSIHGKLFAFQIRDIVRAQSAEDTGYFVRLSGVHGTKVRQDLAFVLRQQGNSFDCRLVDEATYHTFSTGRVGYARDHPDTFVRMESIEPTGNLGVRFLASIRTKYAQRRRGAVRIDSNGREELVSVRKAIEVQMDDGSSRYALFVVSKCGQRTEEALTILDRDGEFAESSTLDESSLDEVEVCERLTRRWEHLTFLSPGMAQDLFAHLHRPRSSKRKAAA